jgi:hypothetical protein
MTPENQGPSIFDPVHLCEKCGDLAASEYKSEYNRIKRTCKTCGHSWMELPIDFKESSGKDTK